MRYSVFAGGKRLRPMLTLAAAAAVEARSLTGCATFDVAPAGPAIEAALPAARDRMIHLFADSRRSPGDGLLHLGEDERRCVVYGDGIAILAGDGLHAEAPCPRARAGDGRSDPAAAGSR
jgi:geranylgeranyl pyrophosphate synthase